LGVAQKIAITLIWEDGTEEKINPNSVKHLRITKKLNDHVKLFFSGRRVEVSERETFLYRASRETRIKVTYTGENSDPALIFAGVATRIKLWFVPGENYYYMKLNGSSETYWLNMVRRRRSFQNKEMPYQKALDKIAAGSWPAVISAGKELMEKNSKESKKLGQFTLQYQETDWQFLKRLASRFQTGLVPDPIAGKPSLCVGLPEGKEYSINEPLILWIIKRINKHQIVKANYDQTSIPEEYVYYKLRTNQFLDIGDTVTLPGIQPALYVYLSTAYIRGSELYFETIVTPYGGLRQKPRYNRQLPGVTLDGHVIDVGGPDDDPLKDKVKVRINFDDPTPPEEAAWLPYATYYSAENHTGFYCLPELGDYVKIRFSSTNEDKAVVVSSTRLERDRERLVDHLYTKMFRTNHRKELALNQTGITLSGKEANLQIRLDQDKGVTISSHNELEIRSKGNLNLQAGRKVSISAKKAVDIKCGQSKVVLNENEKSGMIHIFGSKVRKEQGKDANRINSEKNVKKKEGEADTWINPVKGQNRVSSRVGYRTDAPEGASTWHTGTDYAPIPAGTKPDIVSIGEGIVITVHDNVTDKSGKYVQVSYVDEIVISYCHVDTIYVKKGVNVKKGEAIGKMGNTAKGIENMGIHVHITARKDGKHINPEKLINSGEIEFITKPLL